MSLTDADLDRLEVLFRMERPEDRAGRALIAEVRQWRAWRQLAVEALEIIAGKRPCADPLMGNVAVAQWALDRLPSPPRSEP